MFLCDGHWRFLTFLILIFQKPRTFLKKLKYCFLAESIRIENSTFLCKTALSEANVKRNRIERSFASNSFIFLKILFQCKDVFTKSWLDVPTTNMSIFILFVSIGILFEGAFSLWVPLKLPKLSECFYTTSRVGKNKWTLVYKTANCQYWSNVNGLFFTS